jgi:transcriptional regulator with XRE-family HTH domain
MSPKRSAAKAVLAQRSSALRSTTRPSGAVVPAQPARATMSGAHTLDRTAFGKRVRAARKAFGWTLMQVAQASGISTTTISRAERGQLALSYEKFSALARALRMDLAAMFSETGNTTAKLEGPLVTRDGEGVSYRGIAFEYQFLTTQASGKQMSPILGTVHARKIHGPQDFARHEGEEWIYLLSGTVEVHFEDGRVIELAKGDTLYFDSRIGHAYISTSRAAARTIGACTSESGAMKAARQRAPATAKAVRASVSPAAAKQATKQATKRPAKPAVKRPAARGSR